MLENNAADPAQLKREGADLYAKKDYIGSIEKYNEALSIYSRQFHRLGMVECHAAIARCLIEQGKYSKAIERFLDASVILKPIKQKEYLTASACCHYGVGACSQMQEKYSEAIKFYKKSLGIFKSNEDWQRQADCHVKIGICEFEKGEPMAARASFDAALKLYEKSPDALGRAECYFFIALSHEMKGKEKNKKKVTEYYEKVRKEIIAAETTSYADGSWLKFLFSIYKGMALCKQGNVQQGMQTFDAAFLMQGEVTEHEKLLKLKAIRRYTGIEYLPPASDRVVRTYSMPGGGSDIAEQAVRANSMPAGIEYVPQGPRAFVRTYSMPGGIFHVTEQPIRANSMRAGISGVAPQQPANTETAAAVMRAPSVRLEVPTVTQQQPPINTEANRLKSAVQSYRHTNAAIIFGTVAEIAILIAAPQSAMYAATIILASILVIAAVEKYSLTSGQTQALSVG